MEAPIPTGRSWPVDYLSDVIGLLCRGGFHEAWDSIGKQILEDEPDFPNVTSSQ